jgi:hypothetical protein
VFKRKWRWFGPLISDEGFNVSYAHKTVVYRDDRGSFEFGFEDGYVFPGSLFQTAGDPVKLSRAEADEIVDRVVRWVRADGGTVEIFTK